MEKDKITLFIGSIKISIKVNENDTPEELAKKIVKKAKKRGLKLRRNGSYIHVNGCIGVHSLPKNISMYFPNHEN